MKRCLLLVPAVLALGLLAAVPPRSAGEDIAKAKEMLARVAGSWDYEMVMMGMPALKGSETSTLMPHGLAVVTTTTGDMGPMGKFDGHGLIGFDPKSGKWLHAWTDNTDPGLSVSEGRWSEDGMTFTIEEDVDLGMGPKPTKLVTHITGPDSMEFTMIAKDAPAEAAPMVRMSYKRHR